MIQAEFVQHVSIPVTDLEKAKAFYRDVLGLAEIERPAFDFPGAWFAIGSQQLHLIVHTPAKTLRGTTALDTRDGHFAIRIKDYDAAVKHFEASQVTFVANPNNKTDWGQIFLTDPDGNVIELNAFLR
ncbi:VOC family protein [Alicyclobacillus fodiniaquatilis]|jgi:catechol 2,3-dioxygenase-like lactoylglutathione lyase family enzyme|uniref:VOC family protein n=1 Tax=Alicyclobacillus fodiniaquatilis TaxID=1661150 RepID=A0ABW4JHB6_9BACL